jgi:hypothetical protein
MSYSPFSKFSRFEHQKMFRKYFLSTNIDKRFHVAEQFYFEPATFWILNTWMNSILQNIRTWLTSRTESCEIYSRLKNKDSEKAPNVLPFTLEVNIWCHVFTRHLYGKDVEFISQNLNSCQYWTNLLAKPKYFFGIALKWTWLF